MRPRAVPPIAPIVFAGLLLLTGCADNDLRTEVYANPMAAYDAAKIAEGAYLASAHATPEGLARLVQLDRTATLALIAYRRRPGPEQAQNVQLAIAALADYLSTGIEL
jgi:RecB family exonuclease